MRSLAGTEEDLYEEIAQYMRLRFPNVCYHFDLSGVYNPSHRTRNLYGRLQARAWPDLFIAHPTRDYHGLFIELKKEGTKVWKKDGTLRKDEHLEEQSTMLLKLRERGYRALFASGFNEAKELIDGYLT